MTLSHHVYNCKYENMLVHMYKLYQLLITWSSNCGFFYFYFCVFVFFWVFLMYDNAFGVIYPCSRVIIAQRSETS